MTEPTQFVQGSTVSWTRSFSDYSPDDGWAATYYFVSNTDSQEVPTTDDGDGGFSVSIDATQSAEFNAEVYTWQVRLVNGAEVVNPDAGRTDVLPDFSTSNSLDTRTHVKKVLDALQTLLEGKALKGDQTSYTIKSRTLSRMTPEEILEWYQRYKGWYREELRHEEIAKGLGGNGRMIKVRFT